ncbi:MAG: hypothetical protein ABIG95_03095 [Candidatus Woesearchaeota archaeon]
MVNELDEIKKLGPEQRIASLRKLETKRKQEIEEARKLISSSQEEIKLQEELKDIPIPQVKAVNIDALFSSEEKEVFKTKRFISEQPKAEEPGKVESSLDTIAAEQPARVPKQAAVQYADQLEEALNKATVIQQNYNTIIELAQDAAQGNLPEYQMQRLQNYQQALHEVYATMKAQEERFQRLDERLEKIQNVITAADKAVYEALGRRAMW